MSRLYDRILTEGCRPLTAGALASHGGRIEDRVMRGEIEAALGRPVPVRELERLRTRAAAEFTAKIVGPRLNLTDLESAIVIAGDDVARYFDEFPMGTDIGDVVASVAPPFERMFIEFEGAPNPFGLLAWGVLFDERQHDSEKWVVEASLIEESRKGRSVGPVVTWLLPLTADGRLQPRGVGGYGSIFVRPVDQSLVPTDVFQDFGDRLTALLGPALLTISFMHCRNVDVHAVEPSGRVSRSVTRKHGRAPSRYYVLDIEPMRRVLQREGHAATRGLRHALHICRGHFKTYTDTGPLFGRLTGTYWWESFVRGDADQGIIEKDYRVRLQTGALGRPYEIADEQAEIAVQPGEHEGLDPDLGGRGLRAHAITQNLLAQEVERAGYAPRRPRPDEPQYDLAWHDGAVTWVAEVKSLTATNEERQLRLALGQVMRYRQLLTERDAEVRAVIAVEHEPKDATWQRLCNDEGIAMLWPGRMDLSRWSGMPGAQ